MFNLLTLAASRLTTAHKINLTSDMLMPLLNSAQALGQEKLKCFFCD